MSKACTFDKAWVGKCGKPAEGEFCPEHTGLKCCSCGAPANHTCYETGQFVCGELLCPECDHATFPDGTNGGIGFNMQSTPEGMKRHCKKSEQVYEPWYARAERSE